MLTGASPAHLPSQNQIFSSDLFLSLSSLQMRDWENHLLCSLEGTHVTFLYHGDKPKDWNCSGSPAQCPAMARGVCELLQAKSVTPYRRCRKDTQFYYLLLHEGSSCVLRMPNFILSWITSVKKRPWHAACRLGAEKPGASLFSRGDVTSQGEEVT